MNWCSCFLMCGVAILVSLKSCTKNQKIKCPRTFSPIHSRLYVFGFKCLNLKKSAVCIVLMQPPEVAFFLCRSITMRRHMKVWVLGASVYGREKCALSKVYSKCPFLKILWHHNLLHQCETICDSQKWEFSIINCTLAVLEPAAGNQPCVMSQKALLPLPG